MKLELFSFIDRTTDLYEKKMPSFQYAEGQLIAAFRRMFNSGESIVNIHTRIKTVNSLREKLIRNEFYLAFDEPEDALDNLSDLIGIIMQCRFIRNEAELYKQLFRYFRETGKGYSECIADSSIFLNLRMPQPQIQRNGFTIFRIDGYYLFNDTRINFELQIKSLVHAFWSEIEHEVVYKNPEFIMYDTFNRSMLGAIRDNLDVVDRQLEIMYKEIALESKTAQIGMDEQGFKLFVARSINELVNRKMKESIGFATDFKKCSATIAQYIYVHDFANGENNRERMIEYLELLTEINQNPLDFSQELIVDKIRKTGDSFIDTLSEYLTSRLNTHFQWHVFFTILFETHRQNDPGDVVGFVEVIKMLLIQPRWYAGSFTAFTEDQADEVREVFQTIFAESLVDADTVKIVYEDMLYRCMTLFRSFIDKCSRDYESYDELKADLPMLERDLRHQIAIVFH